MEKLIKLLTEMNASKEVIDKFMTLDENKQEFAYQLFTSTPEQTEKIIEILDQYEENKTH